MLMNSTDRVLISPSVIATDLTTIGTRLAAFDPAIIDLLHLDVMDGNFVPNITIGPDYIRSLQQHTAIPLDVHLMIERPENSIERYIEIKPWAITVHYESTRFPLRSLKKIREQGIRAGLSINIATPVDAIADLLPYCDMVLIMSVDPGFSGQKFMAESLQRISRLRSRLEGIGCADSVQIQVDGGITAENIGAVVQAGARVIVVGTAAFAGGDIHQAVKNLKERAR